MYKTELIRRIARETRLSQRIVGDVIEATQQIIQQSLRTGQRIILPGFGAFYTRKRQARRVRHIRTGREITVRARTVAAFRAGEVLKRVVAGKSKRKAAKV